MKASAQVLARPGWAGSGVAPESWWRRAVFYRIDPARFQDSNGDGTGDLEGIAQRLDYLQSVGVDALLLDSGSGDGSLDADGLEDLVREASRHHLRVLVTVGPATGQLSRDALLRRVHDWLSAGAAGVWVPKADLPQIQSGGYPGLISAIRQVLQSFPGERVLITDPLPQSFTPTASEPRPRRRSTRGDGAPFSSPGIGGLVSATPFPVNAAEVGGLRASLAGATQGSAPDSDMLLRFAQDPATGSPNGAADAAVLLASRGAALFDFGTEIGLDLARNATSVPGTTSAPTMQWTPSNHTPAPVEQAEKAPPAPGSVTEFGAYHPYRPPPRDLRGSTTPSARVVPDANIPADLPDPDSLPGFTAGTLPAPPLAGAKLNVTTEDRDPKSLLNAYRTLIGLHHDNATLRNGTQFVLNRDAEGALVWIRRAPAGSRTVANVVVAANLSGRTVSLALDADIDALGMRPGALRPLFVYSSSPLTGETTSSLTLPPHAVYLGEIIHAGAVARPAERSRRSRHRVRR